MSDQTIFWLVAMLAAFFVGMSKGGLPMIAQLSVPTISLAMSPLMGAALLLPVYLISDGFGLWIYRREFSSRNLRILIPASAIGIAVGYLLAGRVSDDMVRVVIGCVGLAFIALRWRTRFLGVPKPREASISRGLFWGSISGFTSFVSHAGGPALQAYTIPQQMPKMVFAGTSTIFFAVVNLMKVPPYLALGLFDIGDAGLIAALAPIALLGTWAGYRITQRLRDKTFFIIIEISLLFISLNLIRMGLTG